VSAALMIVTFPAVASTQERSISASHEMNQAVTDYLTGTDEELRFRERHRELELNRSIKIPTSTLPRKERPSDSFGIVVTEEPTAQRVDRSFNPKPEPRYPNHPEELSERWVMGSQEAQLMTVASRERYIHLFKQNALRGGYFVEVDPLTLEVTKVEKIRDESKKSKRPQ
jgi:hypothetical protein